MRPLFPSYTMDLRLKVLSYAIMRHRFMAYVPKLDSDHHIKLRHCKEQTFEWLHSKVTCYDMTARCGNSIVIDRFALFGWMTE